jgi:hypothetical protein
VPITWDERDWPIARYHAAGELRTADIEGQLRQIGEYLTREQRFGILTTVDGVSRTDPGTAKLQAQWAAENADALREYVVGWASVVEPDALEFQRQRAEGMAKLVPFELAAFSTEGECVTWLASKLG